MPKLHAWARRIHVRNATQIMINAANKASEIKNAARDECADSAAKYTAPIAATPAALPICTVVPYMPDAEPAAAGLTVESTALDNGAMTRPCP